MKPSELLFDKTIPNKDKFSLFLKWRRIEAKLSIAEMAKELGISPELLTAFENGQFIIPTKLLDKMIKVFEIPNKEVDYFYDLAGIGISNWADINEFLEKEPSARKLLRVIKERELSADDIEMLIDSLTRENVR